MTRSLTGGLNPRPPALKASTLPLGYRGGGPWLGIEPGTSRTQSQHSTTRLSRRRCFGSWQFYLTNYGSWFDLLLFNMFWYNLNYLHCRDVTLTSFIVSLSRTCYWTSNRRTHLITRTTMSKSRVLRETHTRPSRLNWILKVVQLFPNRTRIRLLKWKLRWRVQSELTSWAKNMLTSSKSSTRFVNRR